MKTRHIQISLCIALIATISGSCSSQRCTRIGACVASINTLHTVVDVWRMDHGRYPTEAEGLDVLLRDMREGNVGPYLGSKELPRDPWGNPFRYRLIDEKPVIDSAGPDGKFGTKDDIDKNTKVKQRNMGCTLLPR